MQYFLEHSAVNLLPRTVNYKLSKIWSNFIVSKKIFKLVTDKLLHKAI